MRFSPGDLVIKKTGGNKMKVISSIGDIIECAWICENYNQSNFFESDLISYEQYASVLVHAKREDILKQILK